MKTLIASLLLLLLAVNAQLSTAQELFLKPVSGEHAQFYLNASAHDGITVPFPDVDSTNYFSVFFDLGFTNPANVAQSFIVYGDIPPGSNVKLAAIINESTEGFGHRWVFIDQGRPDNSSDGILIARALCPYPYRHLALLRYAEWNASCPLCKPAIISKPFPTNGKDAYVDALALVRKNPIVIANSLYINHIGVARVSQGNKSVSIFRNGQ